MNIASSHEMIIVFYEPLSGEDLVSSALSSVDYTIIPGEELERWLPSALNSAVYSQQTSKFACFLDHTAAKKHGLESRSGLLMLQSAGTKIITLTHKSIMDAVCAQHVANDRAGSSDADATHSDLEIPKLRARLLRCALSRQRLRDIVVRSRRPALDLTRDDLSTEPGRGRLAEFVNAPALAGSIPDLSGDLDFRSTPRYAQMRARLAHLARTPAPRSEFDNRPASGETVTAAIVMMVKDEEDIIYDNLRWHFGLGFRSFLLLDNASTDGTRAEIDRFKRFANPLGGRIAVIQDDEEGYYQSIKTTAAARFASLYFPAAWVFPLDADEFLDLGRRGLGEVLSGVTKHMSALLECHPHSPLFAAGLRIPLRNFMSTDQDDPGETSTVRRMIYRQRRGDGRKVAALWRHDYAIAQGNHHIRLEDGTTLPTADAATYGVSIRHYRVRSFEHFCKKVRNGGAAYEKAPGLDPRTGAHWREYYRVLNSEGPEALRALFEAKFTGTPATLVFDPLPDFHDRGGLVPPFPTPHRFKKLHLARAPIDEMVVEGQVVSPYSVSVQAPGVATPVELRTGTSDLPTFYQVFTRGDYDIMLQEPPRSIVDLGANIGLASLFFHSRYPDATIVAVEPNPENYRMLLRNVMGIPQIQAVHGAVWHERGLLSLVEKDERGAALGFWGSQTRSLAEGDPAGLQVEAFTVSDIMERFQLDQVDLLKVDIEGAELELFGSGPDSWLRRVRVLLVETHDRFRAGSEAAVRTALSRHAFVESRKGENLIFQRSREGPARSLRQA